MSGNKALALLFTGMAITFIAASVVVLPLPVLGEKGLVVAIVKAMIIVSLGGALLPFGKKA